MTPHHPEARFQTPEQLVAHCRAEYRPLSFKKSLPPLLDEEIRAGSDRGRAAIEVVAVAERFGFSPADILGRARGRRLFTARWEAMRRAKASAPALNNSTLASMFDSRTRSAVELAVKLGSAHV